MVIKDVKTNYKIENLRFKDQNPKNGHLFVRFKSPATVRTSDGYAHAKPGDFIFYHQSELCEYRDENGVFIHDYFRFFSEIGDGGLFSVETSRLYRFPISDKAEDLLRLLNLEYYSASELRARSLSLIGELFMISVSEQIKSQRLFTNTPKYEDISNLRLLMLSAPEKDWSIEKLSERVFMSPTLFQKTYKKCFGDSCISELIKARINKACFLLRYTDKKETEISAICGYKNVEHFIRQFKKHKSTTPSRYRKQNPKPLNL